MEILQKLNTCSLGCIMKMDQMRYFTFHIVLSNDFLLCILGVHSLDEMAMLVYKIMAKCCSSFA